MEKEELSGSDYIPSDIGWGCCAGSCLGSLFNFTTFVVMLIWARRNLLPDPYNDMDVLFSIGAGIFIGGVIGAIINPVFRGYIRKKRKL